MYAITSIELGLLSEFCTPSGGSHRATSICFCYYYCHRFSCHFNATQRHLGVVKSVSLGALIVCGNGRQSCTSVAGLIYRWACLDILDKVCAVYLGILHLSSAAEADGALLYDDKWWLIKRWISERHGSSSRYQVIVRLLSSLFILDMTCCWALPVWIYCFSLINSCRNTAIVIFQIGFYHLKAPACFWICTMIIQGLFYSRKSTVLFSVLGVSF